MASLRFKQVDVFTRRPFFGNPVAVILDGGALDASAMQQLAAWTNLSETTFVLPPTAPDADYRVRILTPRTELPFAGHPTIGTAHAVLEAGLARPRDGKLRQECGAGVLTIAVEGDGAEQRLAVEVPAAKFETISADTLGRLADALGAPASTSVTPKIVDVGPRWLTVELADAATVRKLRPNDPAIAALSGSLAINGITVFGRASGESYALAVRSFAPAEGVVEDPVCGSGNAAVGALLGAARALPAQSYVASQGRELGRDGYVTVRVDSSTGRTWIGGTAVTCIDGMLTT
jgi:PhzF family phenazine biosynthesis protein